MPEREPGVAYRRPWTDVEVLPTGGRRMTVKRCCNGCRRPIGDMDDRDMETAVNGDPLPDVTAECPWCSPAWVDY